MSCGLYVSYSSIARFLVPSSEQDLRPSDPSLFVLFVAPWHHQLSLQYYTCVKLLEIMLKRVQTLLTTMETQHVTTNENFALDFALLVNLVISTLKRCQKTVTDCVATHSSWHKELASIICAKLLMEDHVVSTC